jgi:hypothetical protein
VRIAPVDIFEETTHMALRFMTLGPSKADAERPLNVQPSLQGLHNTKYRSDALLTRVLPHGPRGINTRKERQSMLDLEK